MPRGLTGGDRVTIIWGRHTGQDGKRNQSHLSLESESASFGYLLDPSPGVPIYYASESVPKSPGENGEEISYEIARVADLPLGDRFCYIPKALQPLGRKGDEQALRPAKLFVALPLPLVI